MKKILILALMLTLKGNINSMTFTQKIANFSANMWSGIKNTGITVGNTAKTTSIGIANTTNIISEQLYPITQTIADDIKIILKTIVTQTATSTYIAERSKASFDFITNTGKSGLDFITDHSKAGFNKAFNPIIELSQKTWDKTSPVILPVAQDIKSIFNTLYQTNTSKFTIKHSKAGLNKILEAAKWCSIKAKNTTITTANGVKNATAWTAKKAWNNKSKIATTLVILYALAQTAYSFQGSLPEFVQGIMNSPYAKLLDNTEFWKSTLSFINSKPEILEEVYPNPMCFDEDKFLCLEDDQDIWPEMEKYFWPKKIINIANQNTFDIAISKISTVGQTIKTSFNDIKNMYNLYKYYKNP